MNYRTGGILALGACLLLLTASIAPVAHAQAGGVMSAQQVEALIAESNEALADLARARDQSVPPALKAKQDIHDRTYKDDLRQNVLPPDVKKRLETLAKTAADQLRTGDPSGAQLTLVPLRAGLATEIERFKAITDYWTVVVGRWQSGRKTRNELLRTHGIEPLALSKEAEALEARFDEQIKARNFTEAMRVTRPKYLEVIKRAEPEEFQQLLSSLESGALQGIVTAAPKRQCVPATETSRTNLPVPRDFPAMKDYYTLKLQGRGIVGTPMIFVIVDAKGCPERAVTIAPSRFAEMDAAAAQMGADAFYYPAESEGAPRRSGMSFRLKFDAR